MDSEKQQPIDYASVIADLEAKRAELNRTIESLRKMANLPTPEGEEEKGTDTSDLFTPPRKSNGNTEVRSDTFFGQSIPQAAKNFLGMCKRPKSTREIATALETGGILSQSKNFLATVHTAMNRDDAFVRVKKQWGLADWYPAGVKKKQSQPKDDSSDGNGGGGDTN